MSFSLFQVNLPFHAVFQFLKLLPPASEKTAEDWSGAEAEGLKLGDIVFLLEPIFSPWGNSKQGIGVSEGDKFRVTNMLLIFRLDAGFPMCLSLTADSYEMEFVEALLCVKADLAREKGQGFYYLHARPKTEPSIDELAMIADMHRWGKSGKRSAAPKDLPEPAFQFFTSLQVPVDETFIKQAADIEMFAYYLFTDNEQNLSGKAPNLRPYYAPVRRPDNAYEPVPVNLNPAGSSSFSSPSSTVAPAASSGGGGGMSLNSLLSDDWEPTPAPPTLPPPPVLPPVFAKPPQPVPPVPNPPNPAPQSQPRGFAAEIASMVENLLPQDGSKGSKNPGGAPGSKPSLLPPPMPPQPKIQLQPPPHPLKKGGPGSNQLINTVGAGAADAAPGPSAQNNTPAATPPPPPVPMFKGGVSGKNSTMGGSAALDAALAESLKNLKALNEEDDAKKESEKELERLGAELMAAQNAAAEQEAARIAAEDAARIAAEEQARIAEAQRAEEAARVAAEQEAARIAAEQEAARIAAEQEAARIAAEQEAARIAAEQEAARIAAEQEAARIAAEQEAARIAAEQEAARIAAEEEAARIAAEEETARIVAEEEAARIAAEQEAARSVIEKEFIRLAAEQEAARVELAIRAEIELEMEAERMAAEREAAREIAERETRIQAEQDASFLAAERVAAGLPSSNEFIQSADEAKLESEVASDQVNPELVPDLINDQSIPPTKTALDKKEAALLAQQQQLARLTSQALTGFNPFEKNTPPASASQSAAEASAEASAETSAVPPELSTATENSGIADPFASISVPEVSRANLLPPLFPDVESITSDDVTRERSPEVAEVPEGESSIHSVEPAGVAPTEETSESTKVEILNPFSAVSPVAVPAEVSELTTEQASPVEQGSSPATPVSAFDSLSSFAAQLMATAAETTVTGSADASKPVAEIPEAEVPAAEVPAAEVPEAEVPEAEVPEAEVPVAEVPAAEVPAAEVPAAEVPAAEVPAAEVPAAEVPATEIPAAEIPAAETPAAETPAAEIPATGLPTTGSAAPNAVLPITPATNPATGVSTTPPIGPAASIPPARPIIPSIPTPVPSSAVPAMARVTASSGVPGQGAPAGVGGLIAKLEQQAQRATARLEQKLDEIQERQHKDITLTISKLAIKEQASLKNILSLKTVLSRRLGSTSEELKEQIAESVTASCQLISEGTSSSSAAIGTLNNTLVNEVLQLFDELGASAPELTKGYSKKADDQHTQGLAALNEVLVLMKARLEEISRQHSTFLQNAYDRLNKRVTELAQHSDTELTSAYERLRAETQIYRLDYVGRLDSLSAELLDSISESIALSVLNIQMHSEVRGGNVLLPRLLNYKQLLEGKVQELRDKYKEEVEKSSLERLVELRPMVANQREKLEQAARDARQLRATVEVGQRQEFEKIHDSLVQFIDSKIAEARGLAEFSADELSQIEKSVSVLSDAAGIEADPELAASRAQVLTKLQYIGKQLQGNVNESLRGQIASMEDKGRMLQEELISSMEGNAYAVRKSSETSLAKVKQALEAAYQEISELQNHYLQ